MQNNRSQSSARSRGRRKGLQRVKPPKYTFLLLILLLVLLILLVIFSPTISTPPATNVSGTEVDPETAGTGNIRFRITEVMSSNRTAFPDETGAFPDWIELSNTSQEDISIGGYGLSDRDDKILFVFPDILLAPGEHIIVFASDTTKNTAGETLHANFKISSAGDTLFLFGTDGIAYEKLEVPAMDANMSYAWIGDENYIITQQYSPGYDNNQEGYAAFRSETVLPSGQLVINEICASSITTLADEDGEYPDWIEIHNNGSNPIDLSNYALSDNSDNLVKWRFPQGTILPGGGYFVVFASGKDRPASAGSWPHASFRLRSNTETVILSDIQGRMIDLVTYDNLQSDTSWGRDETNDPSNFKVFTQPTPGMPNIRSSETAMDTALCLANTSGLYITEVMTGNTKTHTPGVNYFYDYVEIYNMSGQAVNLKGYGLSDNIKKPRKWQFPDLTIENNSYIVIYCDKTQTSKPGVYTFTDFGLKQTGETVVLSTPEGKVLDKVVVPQLYDDTSYGRTLGQAGLFYYSNPTPGEPNTTGFVGYTDPPEFLKTGGNFERPLSEANGVTLTVPRNAVVRYTTDGSDPTIYSEKYTGPIPIEKSTVIRARAFQDGLEPSPIVSSTYLIAVYHTLPIVCITVDPDHLWNEENGMFADGPNIDRENTDPPWKNATYWQKNWFGGWIEYLDTTGTRQISQGMTFRVMGQYSLDMPQKSLYIKADSQYGKDSFDYAFFDDRPYTSYASIVLRNGGQDGLYTRVIDGMQARLIDQSGSSVVTQAWRPVIVYINGEYYGHYNLRERAGYKMVAQHEGWLNADDIDMLESNGTSSTQVNHGSNAAYKELVSYVESHDLANDTEAFQYVCSQVDVDNMIDYFIFESFFGNTDPGNIRFYRNAKSGDGKWRYLFYDSDWGFFNVTLSKNKISGGVAYVLNEKGMGSQKIKSNVLIRNLIKNPEIREKFLLRYGELYRTVFTTEYLTNLFNSMIAQIKPEMDMHMQRWASKVHKKISFDQPKNPEGGYNYWVTRCERMLTRIFPRRPYYIYNDIQSYFGLSDEQMLYYLGPRLGTE
ncbi:MAG: lamin tail domain-containing protein [Clostridia bacterium]|nr:lamin tail domain-containing protein [Clostridia bacterium]